MHLQFLLQKTFLKTQRSKPLCKSSYFNSFNANFSSYFSILLKSRHFFFKISKISNIDNKSLYLNTQYVHWLIYKSYFVTCFTLFDTIFVGNEKKKWYFQQSAPFFKKGPLLKKIFSLEAYDMYLK